jgi:hypothetical protein
MGFLRRLLGGGVPSDAPAADARPGSGPVAGAESPVGAGPGPVADELARDRELLLEDARRLDDDLIQRQLRYADRSWTPPPQGGPRRADDTEGGEDEPALNR